MTRSNAKNASDSSQAPWVGKKENKRPAALEALASLGIECDKNGRSWTRVVQGARDIEGFNGPQQARVEIEAFGKPPSIDPHKAEQADMVLAWFDAAMTSDQALDAAAESARKWMGKALEESEPDARKLEKTLQKALQTGSKLEELKEAVEQAYAQWSANWRIKRKAGELESQLSLDAYPMLFPLARSMRREIEIFTGPTNSGKTYAGMQLLAAARSGAYLAPLRLLAMEGHEAMIGRGMACSLVTGEERRIDPEAAFVASTVEMADFNTELEVAVIDEAQMLADKDRGWAWTAAICGIPAKKVAIVCAPEALDMVSKLLWRTGEAFSVHRFERKNPLDATGKSVDFGRLQDGDALIAFSRKNVLMWRDKVVAMGKSVAVVYGALAPEVRRSEAKRFAEGKAQILVATDAIGMGLNLPIKRIIFTTAVKFDGEETRQLATQEMRQIAGRAGRYGMEEKGTATALEPEDARIVAKALGAGVESLGQRASIAPNDRQIEQMSQAMGTDKLSPILSFFRDHLVKSDPLFQASGMEDMMALAWIADRRLGLDLGTRFSYAKTPLDRNDTDHAKVWESWMRAHEQGKEARAPIAPMAPRSSREDDKLWEYERAMKLLSAYCWLSWRFEAVFTERLAAEQAREDLSEKIEGILARMSSGKANKPLGAKLQEKPHGKSSQGGGWKNKRKG